MHDFWRSTCAPRDKHQRCDRDIPRSQKVRILPRQDEVYPPLSDMQSAADASRSWNAVRPEVPPGPVVVLHRVRVEPGVEKGLDHVERKLAGVTPPLRRKLDENLEIVGSVANHADHSGQHFDLPS